MRPKDGAERSFYSNVFKGSVEISETKRSKRHLLVTFENKKLVTFNIFRGRIFQEDNLCRISANCLEITFLEGFQSQLLPSIN